MRIIADQNIPLAAEAFSGFGEVVTLPGRALSAADVGKADALLVRSVTRVDRSLLEGSNIRFVGSATSGIDHVDLAYLEQRGIAFAAAPGSNANSVAEYVVTAVLAILAARGEVLAGRSVGIIGCGHVGSRVAALFAALGCRCLWNDPPRARTHADGPYVPLAEALHADIVTLHVPLTLQGPDRTFGLLAAEQLACLQPEAILINTARGGVIAEAVLLALLASRSDLRLVIDCWAGEPAISAPLLEHAVIGTPHIAGYSYRGKLRATADLHVAFSAFLGQRPCWTLPEIRGPRLSSGPVSASPPAGSEAGLARAVTGCYDVYRDDSALRQALRLPAAQSGAAFDELRRSYPIRYEFADCIVDAGTLAADPGLQRRLLQLGFRVSGQ